MAKTKNARVFTPEQQEKLDALRAEMRAVRIHGSFKSVYGKLRQKTAELRVTEATEESKRQAIRELCENIIAEIDGNDGNE